MSSTVVVASIAGTKFQHRVTVGPNQLITDEPPAFGGDQAGPDPFEMVLAGLGSCTSMTIKMYAERKGLPLEGVTVTLSHTVGPEGFLIQRQIALAGPLSDEQRQRLLEIANKCPVHKALHGKIEVSSALV